MSDHDHSVQQPLSRPNAETHKDENMHEPDSGASSAMQQALVKLRKETISPGVVSQLQRTLGNSAVLKLLGREKSSHLQQEVVQRQWDGHQNDPHFGPIQHWTQGTYENPVRKNGWYRPGKRGFSDAVLVQADDDGNAIPMDLGDDEILEDEAQYGNNNAQDHSGDEADVTPMQQGEDEGEYGEGVLGFAEKKKPGGYGSVSLKATLNGFDLGHTWSQSPTYTEDAEHAEDALVDFIQMIEAYLSEGNPAYLPKELQEDEVLMNALLESIYKNKQRNLIITDLTASPCSQAFGTNKKVNDSGCAEKLIELKKHYKYEITIYAEHYYQPNFVGDAKKRSIKAVKMMQDAGIKVNISNP